MGSSTVSLDEGVRSQIVEIYDCQWSRNLVPMRYRIDMVTFGSSPTSQMCCCSLTNGTLFESEMNKLSADATFIANDKVTMQILSTKHKVQNFFFLDRYR